MQTKRVEKLDGIDALGFRLNASAFRKGILRGYSERRLKITEDTMLLYTKRPIPSSLLKLPSKDSKMAVEMFGWILDWMNLTNGPSNVKRRSELENKILQHATSPLDQELYLQLLKQSRGNGEIQQERNAWKLFSILSSHIPCPESLLEFVSKYVLSVALKAGEDPLLRSMAFDVMDAIKSGSQEQRSIDAQLTSDWHLSGDLFAWTVHLVDGTKHELVYDSQTTVEEALRQMGWKLGLPRLSNVVLYKERGGDLFPLDPKSLLGQSRSQEGSEKLVFKKEMFRKKEKHITDPDFVVYAYLQAKQQYLDSGYPVQNDKAIQLCALQLLAENDASILNDQIALANCVAAWKPKKLNSYSMKFYELPTQSRWERDVVESAKNLGALKREEAQIEFLNVLRKIPYGNCMFFKVKTSGFFPVPLPDRSELMLGINYSNMHFFRPGMRDCVVTTQVSHIASCTCQANKITFTIGWITEWCYFDLETEHGEEIVHLLQTFKRDINRVKRIPKRKSKAVGMSQSPDPSGKSMTSSPEDSEMELTSASSILSDDLNIQKSKKVIYEDDEELETSPDLQKASLNAASLDDASAVQTLGKWSSDAASVQAPLSKRSSHKLKKRSSSVDEVTTSSIDPSYFGSVQSVKSIGESAKPKTKEKPKERKVKDSTKSMFEIVRMLRNRPKPEVSPTPESKGSQTSGSTTGIQDREESVIEPLEGTGRFTVHVHSDYDRTRLGQFEESTLPMNALNRLKPGTTFAGKYKIQSERLGNEKDKFLAMLLPSKREVLLKFYKSMSRFERSKELHRRLLQSKHISKLLDVLDTDVDYPPCMVFEKGEMSLEQWSTSEDANPAEKKSILRQVLLALTDVHEVGAVYCNLKPANIMFFQKQDTWKLVELSSAVWIGKPSQVSITITFAAPEVIQAERDEKTEIVPQPTIDMWAFGVFAFELISGFRYYGPDATSALIRSHLCSAEPLPNLERLERERDQSFLAKFLRKVPRDRLSAKEAAEHTFFDAE